MKPQRLRPTIPALAFRARSPSPPAVLHLQRAAVAGPTHHRQHSRYCPRSIGPAARGRPGVDEEAVEGVEHQVLALEIRAGPRPAPVLGRDEGRTRGLPCRQDCP
jgi:hypothetical protein